MNIWYVHPYLGVPTNAEYGRGFFLGKALLKKSVKFRVITSSFHHLIKSDYHQNQRIYSQIISCVPFTWIKTPKYIGNGFKRIINMIIFGIRFRMTDLVKDCYHEKPDVIILSSAHPFHLFGGLYWAKKYDAKLIFEVRDIWPLSLNQVLGMSQIHPLSLMLSWLEKKAYKKADQVISLLPNADQHMQKKGLDLNKYCYIPNGIYIDSSESLKPSRYREYISKLRDNNKFIFMYTGAHGVPNAMEPLLAAAYIVQSLGVTKIQFILIGDGVCKKNLIEYSQKTNIKNVHFLDAIPRGEVADSLRLSDMVFIGGKNLPLYEFGVSPNKMFEYMLVAKPILMTVSSPNNPLELANAGKCLGSNDPEIIANEIIKYSNLSSVELSVIGQRGKKYVEKHHLYNVLAKQYLDVINKIK